MASANQSMEDFRGDHLSVKMFGAVGDGVTDNATAFADAASWANAAENRALFFPPGHYKFSGGLVFTKPVTLYGTRAAILDYTGTGYTVKLGRDGLTEQPPENRDDGAYVISGLTFTGGSLTEHGIFVNEFVTNFEIAGSRFDAFGPTSSNKWAIWLAGGNWRASIRDIDWWNESTKHSNFISGADDPNTQMRVSRVRATQGSHGGKGIRLVGWHNSVSDGQTDFFDQPLIIGAAAGYSTVDNWYMETRSNLGAIGYEWAQGLRVRNCYANLHSNEGATGSFLYPTGGGALILDSDVSDNRIKNLDSTAYLVKQNTTSGQAGNTASGNEFDDTRPFPAARTHTHHTDIEPWYGTDGDALWPHLAWADQVNTFSQDQYYDGESWVRGNQHIQALSFFLNYMALYSGKALTGYSDLGATQKFKLDASDGSADFVGPYRWNGTDFIDSSGNQHWNGVSLFNAYMGLLNSKNFIGYSDAAGTAQTFKLDAATGTADFNGGYKVNGTTVIDSSGSVVGASAISTQSVVTGSRALGTVYHNTTGKPMFVSVIVVVPAGNSVVGYTDSTTSPTTGVAQYGNSTGSSASFSTSFWVLPGNYYKVAGGASTLSTWTEWY